MISTREFPSEYDLIEIGDYVRIAKHTSLYTHGGIFPLRFLKKDFDLEQYGKIKIGSYTSIGAYCMIMPGVTIGSGCIIGGGSVVTKSVPDGCMVAGNPAKFIGYTEEFYKKIKENNDFKCHQLSVDERRKIRDNADENLFIKKGYIKIP